jgi:hypothetical protein
VENIEGMLLAAYTAACVETLVNWGKLVIMEMQCKVLCGLESLPNDTSIVRNVHCNLDFTAQILPLTILVAYEGKRLVFCVVEKHLVSYGEEKHLLSLDEEKLAVSYNEVKHLLCCLQFPTIKKAFIVLG